MTSPPAHRALNVVEFLSHEHECLLTSLANLRDEHQSLQRLDALFEAAVSIRSIEPDEIVYAQLLALIHFHFLNAVSCHFRCHLNEAFSSVRVAIDAALAGAQILHDPSSQLAYASRTKPFDKLNRHLKNLVNNKKPLPHPLVPTLLDQFDKISSFASHADARAFIFKVGQHSQDGNDLITVEYFQYSKDDDERKIHLFTIFHTFVMTLDVFASFLVTKKQSVPVGWHEQLQKLGVTLQDQVVALRASVASKYPSGTSA